jgi:hypothetical protein
MVVISMSSVEAETGIGSAFVEMKTIEDIRKKLQEINEHIKPPPLNNIINLEQKVIPLLQHQIA